MCLKGSQGHSLRDPATDRSAQIIQVNFNSVWVLSQCVVRHMVHRGRGGKIINICSLAAHKAMTTFSVYGPMKAAVGQLTNSFANEFGPYNIQVNAIYPG